MHTSVDINYLRNHISELENQRKETEILAEYLTSWSKTAAFEGNPDYQYIEKHLKMANNYFKCIERRLALLESIIEEFSALKRASTDLLRDAIETLSMSDYKN